MTQGWLEKKSGGHNGKRTLREKWDRRFFTLPAGSTRLSYYKTEQDAVGGGPPAGEVEVKGGLCFLKEVKGQTFRFTLRAAGRELKLRASTVADYTMWTDALTPICEMKQGEEDEVSGRTMMSSVDSSFRPSMFSSVKSPMSSMSQASVASSPGAVATTSGWLEKKSGGKDGKGKLHEKWDRRYFVLLKGGTKLAYYKTQHDAQARGVPAGVVRPPSAARAERCADRRARCADRRQRTRGSPNGLPCASCVGRTVARTPREARGREDA